MSSIPSATLKVDVKADHSCNWRCCFGCKNQVEEASPKYSSDVSVTETETREKVTHVVETHFHNPQPKVKKSHL